jgi:hypothetical protein
MKAQAMKKQERAKLAEWLREVSLKLMNFDQTLAQYERIELADFLLNERARLLKPSHRPLKNADLDFWLSMDFYTRTPRLHAAKRVARDWKISRAGTVTATARNWERRCTSILMEMRGSSPAQLRKLVEMHRNRLVKSQATSD